MAWTNHQKGILGKYRKWAGLSDYDYQVIMVELTGQPSSKFTKLDQEQFDVVMARVEMELETRIADGRVSEPGDQYNPYHWRAKLPRQGRLNNRQLHAIREGWAALRAALPADRQTDAYLLGLIRQAIAWPGLPGIDHLTYRQAGLAIDALHGRFADLQRASKRARGGV